MNSNKPFNRVDRVEKQVLDVLSGILAKNIDLTYLGFVTLTNVTMSADLKHAKVFYSILNPILTDDELNVEINRKCKAFKKYMGPQLRLKTTPSIRFYHDERFTYAEEIDELFKKSGI